MHSPNDLKSLHREAYAKLGWGESEEDVRAWLALQKIMPQERDEIVSACQAELQTLRQELALRNFVYAGGAFALCFAILAGSYFGGHWLNEMKFIKVDELFGYGFMASMVFGIAGAFLLIRAIDYYTGSGGLKQ